MLSKLKIDVNEEKCVGCKLCMLACSWAKDKTYCLANSVIQVEIEEKKFKTKITIDETQCTGCKLCIKNCPEGALLEGVEVA